MSQSVYTKEREDILECCTESDKQTENPQKEMLNKEDEERRKQEGVEERATVKGVNKSPLQS